MCARMRKYFIFTIKVFIMILVFSQSPVSFVFLNEVCSVLIEEVMYSKHIGHHLQFTSNMKKTHKKSSLKCLISQLVLFSVFQW